LARRAGALPPQGELIGGTVKVIVALVIMLAPLVVHAQLVKCVGKDGKVEYAARCPSGVKEEQTGIRSTHQGPTSNSTAPAQKSIAEREAEFRKRQTEQQSAATKQAESEKDAEARKANCDNARAHLSALESGQRIVKIDPATGERSYLGDKDREKAVVEARNSVAGWCK
jgi:hypothetical protein